MLLSQERLRRMYAGGKGDATARAYARWWGRVFALGLLPRRWVTFEVRGRITGRTLRVPVGLARVDGDWYLVSMLGECNWTKNLRAADGCAVLVRRGRHPITATEVAPELRAPIVQRYLQQVAGARPHIPVDRRAPLEAFAGVAPGIPVFRVAGYR